MTLRFEQVSSEEEYKKKREQYRMIDFADGKIPFEYHYIFPSGEKLEATTDQDGCGHIEITKEGKVIFDFANLLPQDYKFITPAYFQKFPEEETFFDYLGNTWAIRHQDKLVLLGEIQSPRDILSLLHEIGHARVDKPEEIHTCEELDKEFYKELNQEKKEEKTHSKKPRYRKKSDYEVLINEEIAKTLSTVERRAWAETIRMFRKIQKDTGIDFHNIFPSFSSMKNYVHEKLSSYRRSYEWIITQGYDPDFYKELQRYFDRWQYKNSSK